MRPIEVVALTAAWVLLPISCARTVDHESSDSGDAGSSDDRDADTAEEQFEELLQDGDLGGEMTSWAMDWAVQAGGATSVSSGMLVGDGANDMVATAQGGTFVTGYAYSDESAFGEGQHTVEANLGLNGPIFIAKYDPTGALVWVRFAVHGTTEFDGDTISSTADGGAVIGGRVSGGQGSVVFDFDGTNPQPLLVDCSSCAFVARYSAEGEMVWVRVVSSSEGNMGWSRVSVATDDSVCLATDFSNNAIFDEQIELPDLSPDRMSLAVAKFTPDGTALWARQLRAADAIALADVVATRDGGCALLYSHNGKGIIQSTEGDVVAPVQGEWGGFVTLFSDVGTVRWITDLGIHGGNWSLSSHVGSLVESDDGFIAAHGFNGELVTPDGVVGYESSNLHAGGKAHFIEKVEEDGTTSWVSVIMGVERDDFDNLWTSNLGILDLDVQEGDDLIVATGWFSHGALFGYGDQAAQYISSSSVGGGNSGFLAAWDLEGRSLWARLVGAGNNDWYSEFGFVGPMGDSPFAVELVPGPAIYLAGAFVDTIAIGPSRNDDVLLTSRGEQDMFLAKFIAANFEPGRGR